jgi:hypothetical protein
MHRHLSQDMALYVPGAAFAAVVCSCRLFHFQRQSFDARLLVRAYPLCLDERPCCARLHRKDRM